MKQLAHILILCRHTKRCFFWLGKLGNGAHSSYWVVPRPEAQLIVSPQA